MYGSVWTLEQKRKLFGINLRQPIKNNFSKSFFNKIQVYIGSHPATLTEKILANALIIPRVVVQTKAIKQVFNVGETDLTPSFI